MVAKAKRRKSSSPRQDPYAAITARIVEALKRGVVPWVQPWLSGQGGLPRNGATNRAYSGINVIGLWAAGYEDARWYTFAQAKAAGAHVRKGEKASQIVFYRFIEREGDAGKKETIPIARLYSVFNHAQIDWGEAETAARPVTPSPATTVVAETGATVRHGSKKACYFPTEDIITMPYAAAFRDIQSYTATLFHELGHWTGHVSRLNRTFGTRFGDAAYAAEELVAEFTAAFLCAECGVDGELQHADYIGYWIQLLESDPKALFTASKAATQATEYILGRQQQQEAEAV